EGDVTTPESAVGLAAIPVVSLFGGNRDSPFQINLPLFQISAQHEELAQRVENHGQLSAGAVNVVSDRKSPLESFLSAIPLAGEHQIDAEVVVSLGSAGSVIGPFVIADSLFQVTNAFVGALQKPAGAGHVGVDTAEDVTGGMITDELDREAEI